MSHEINYLEQYSQRNNLVVYGIPEDKKVNVRHIVKRIATAIQFEDWSTALSDAVLRKGSNTIP